jgi:hypothetical protein
MNGICHKVRDKIKADLKDSIYAGDMIRDEDMKTRLRH